MTPGKERKGKEKKRKTLVRQHIKGSERRKINEIRNGSKEKGRKEGKGKTKSRAKGNRLETLRRKTKLAVGRKNPQ